MDSMLLYFYIPNETVRRICIHKCPKGISFEIIRKTCIHRCPKGTEPENRIRCYALPASITVKGAIGMVCRLYEDEFSWRCYYCSRFKLKVMESGMVLNDNKTLKEQNVKNGMKLALVLEDGEDG